MSDNGGPAFPQNDRWESGYEGTIQVTKQVPGHPGMSLRDWFAGQAMLMCPTNSWEVSEAAKYCYALADAMLKERNIHE
jgi:hypothetical protein